MNDEKKNLWAPWRINYIKSSHTQESCFICKKAKAKEQRKNYVLKKGKKCFSILNIYPYNNGHVMVAPYRHKTGFKDLNKEEMLEIIGFIKEIQNKLNEQFRPDGFNIGFNEGKAAGAGIESHFHFHIVPRWVGDTNFMTTLANTKVIPESLDSVYDKLKNH